MNRRRRLRESLPEPSSPAWMLTYSDMVTLLLAFFVLLFTFSSIDARKFEQALLSMRGALGILPSNSSIIRESSDGQAQIRDQRLVIVPDLRQMVGLENRLRQMLVDNGMAENVDLQIDERGLLIRFRDNVLFDSGRAEIRPDGREILDGIASVIHDIPNQIRVEGHTDDRPIRTIRFPSNWELSTTRATAVIRHFIEVHRIAPERLSAAGYGEYRPVASNEHVDGRQQNRRVDIVILFLDAKWEPVGGGTGQWQ